MAPVREDTGRVVALAAAAWAIVVAAASVEGAFARFEPRDVAMFSALVSLYAVAAFFLDAGLRAHAAQLGRGTARAIAVVAVGALVVAVLGNSLAFATFAAPLAALATAAAVRTSGQRATTASSAKSPGASRAATSALRTSEPR